MSSRFPTAMILALLFSATPTAATAETMTVEDYLSSKPEANAATETAKDDNPFEHIACEATAAVPPTPASSDDSRSVHVIVTGSGCGDFACRMECAPDATVGSVLRKAVFPHPIDFKSTKIAVHRPHQVVNDDLSVELEERILRVDWDAKLGKPTAKTNHRLQANDVLIITPPSAAPVPQPYQPTPVAADTYPAPYTPPVHAGAAPPILAASPQYYAPEATQAVIYSALPAAVPSPFSGDSVVVGTPAAPIIPVPKATPQPAKVTQVKFDIVVVEDLDNSFAEFDELQSRMPFMLTDTATMQGTLRILEKHKLVRRISAPKLISLAGEEANFEVGSVSANSDEPLQGIQAKMGARELGGGLVVDFGFKNTVGRQTNEVQTSLIVPHGQTVVIKTGSQLVEVANGDSTENKDQDKVEPAVYVVLTPEILR